MRGRSEAFAPGPGANASPLHSPRLAYLPLPPLPGCGKRGLEFDWGHPKPRQGRCAPCTHAPARYFSALPRCTSYGFEGLMFVVVVYLFRKGE